MYQVGPTILNVPGWTTILNVPGWTTILNVPGWTTILNVPGWTTILMRFIYHTTSTFVLNARLHYVNLPATLSLHQNLRQYKSFFTK